jgi:hypothetical protein
VAVQVTIFALIEAKAEALLPAEFIAMARSCEDKPDDDAPKWVFADWLADQSEYALEFVFRWMAKNHKWPKWVAAGPRQPYAGWRWASMSDPTFSHELPPYVFASFADGSSIGDHVAPSLYQAVVWLGRRLKFLQDQLDVTQPPLATGDAP